MEGRTLLLKDRIGSFYPIKRHLKTVGRRSQKIGRARRSALVISVVSMKKYSVAGAYPTGRDQNRDGQKSMLMPLFTLKRVEEPLALLCDLIEERC
uniref:Uncharacterized protein n=1 Tax=Arundo donax TaxID=35708 RepID=A0A0A9DVH6_ARUDO